MSRPVGKDRKRVLWWRNWSCAKHLSWTMDGYSLATAIGASRVIKLWFSQYVEVKPELTQCRGLCLFFNLSTTQSIKSMPQSVSAVKHFSSRISCNCEHVRLIRKQVFLPEKHYVCIQTLWLVFSLVMSNTNTKPNTNKHYSDIPCLFYHPFN